MMMEKMQEVTGKGVAGGSTRVERKQEGKTEFAKATGKGIAGSHRRPSPEIGSSVEAALKCQKLAEGDKSEAGKRKRIALVSQEFIDILLKQKATGTGPYRVLKSKALVENYKGRHNFRALNAQTEAIMEKARAEDAKILEQYQRYGFAFTEVEEDNSFINDEKIVGPIARSRPPVPQA